MRVSLWKRTLFSLTFKEDNHFGTSQNRKQDKQYGWREYIGVDFYIDKHRTILQTDTSTKTE